MKYKQNHFALKKVNANPTR